jgi:hypothetical protein
MITRKKEEKEGSKAHGKKVGGVKVYERTHD